MKYLELLQKFFSELDLGRIYVERPDPFIFLCGGRIPNDGELGAAYASLRDYVWRNFDKINVRLVKAESALNLFRDSEYGDLVDFEVDIAQLSELVVLICEGSGSLAELGSFASNNGIRGRLYVIINSEYYDEESFVMLGPVKKISRLDEEAVGALEWPTQIPESGLKLKELGTTANTIIISINRRLTRHRKEIIDLSGDAHKMIIVYWICFILRGATLAEISEVLSAISIPIERTPIKKYLYSMEVAGWIKQINIGSIYYVPFVDRDPFEYAYNKKKRNNSSRASNFKAKISNAVSQESPRPPELNELIGTSTVEVAV